DVDDPAPQRRVGIDESRHAIPACAIDESADRSGRRLEFRRRALHAVVIGDVDRSRTSATAAARQGGRYGVGGGCIDVPYADAGAFGREALGDCAADTARAAGDDDRSIEAAHHEALGCGCSIDFESTDFKNVRIVEST